MSKQSLAEILADQLDQIDELGGPERHQLAQVIGRDAYDAMIAKPKTAALVDRWLDATGKAKGAATKALSIAIAKVADKPALVARIHREITDAFDDGTDRAPTKGEVDKHRAAVNQRRNGQRVAYEKPKGTSASVLAELAKRGDLTQYMKARQSRKEP
jgi:hypothetical protein